MEYNSEMDKILRKIEINWMILLTIMGIFAPIVIYKVALKVSGELKIPANYLFTGLITYLGIIGSISGIYWKTNLDEKIKKRQNEELVYRLFFYSIEDNFNKYRIKLANQIEKEKINSVVIREITNKDLEKKQTIFLTLDTNIIDKKLDSIYLVKEGQKLLKNQRKIRGINESIEKIQNEGIFEKIREGIREICKFIDEKYSEILEREEHILIRTLWVYDSYKEEVKKDMIYNLEEIKKYFGEDVLYQEYSKKFFFNDTFELKVESVLENYINRLRVLNLILNKVIEDKMTLVEKERENITLINNLNGMLSNHWINMKKIQQDVNEVCEDLVGDYEFLKEKLKQ